MKFDKTIKPIFFLPLLLFVISCIQQPKNDKSTIKKKTQQINTNPNTASELTTLIRKADSIVLISHEVPEEYGIQLIADIDLKDSAGLRDWEKKHPKGLNYILNGKVDRQIAIEYNLLTEIGKDSLVEVLGAKAEIPHGSYMCDEPRHSILIYNKGNETFLLICFSCKRVHSSKGIVFTENDMSENKWKNLEIFFRSRKLNRMLDKYKF